MDECYDALFDQAPVMMHSIDEYWRLIRVNRKWEAALGFRAEEVLGLRCVDFLTEVSRTWIGGEALPLFWRSG